MSDAATMLFELSRPWGDGERIKTVIDRTARLCRLSYWRTFDIWYRKARRVEDYEIAQIAEALRIKNETMARNEFHELKLRLARLEAALESRGSDRNSAEINFSRELVRATGRQGRALD